MVFLTTKLPNIFPLIVFFVRLSASFELHLYAATWNTASKYSEKIVLNDFLDLNRFNDSNSQPDLYVIGFQELDMKPLVNLVKGDLWTHLISKALQSRDYVVVKSEQLQGLSLSVYAKRKHLLHLHKIEAQYIGTGLGGFWGNKGAVSIRLNAYGNSFCFVNSHLAAHDNKLEKRVEDYKHILKGLKYNVKPSKEVLSHDYTIWMGDLNFRIQEDFLPNSEDIVKYIQENRLEELIQHDQLLQVRNEQRAFHQFKETLPDFPPTFKFKEGTHEYKLKRRPAWCDRILFHVSEQNQHDIPLVAHQLNYKSHPNYTMSDHKPVSSEFLVQIQEEMTVQIVAFKVINKWVVGEDQVVEYILPKGFKQDIGDWIGIFYSNFTSLSDYRAWQYADEAKQDVNQIKFPATVELKESREYRLLYFKSTGTNGVTELSGISAPFEVEKRLNVPQIDK